MLQIDFKASKFAILPHMCTGIIALVFGVIAAFTASMSKVKVSSISTTTGVAPNIIMASKLATKVKQGIITSSPAPIPVEASARLTAAVPLERS